MSTQLMLELDCVLFSLIQQLNRSMVLQQHVNSLEDTITEDNAEVASLLDAGYLVCIL